MKAIPTAESLRLRAEAIRISDLLIGQTGPRAVLLAGSAGEGTADHFSDIDLIAYYDRLPEPAAVRRLIAGVGAQHERELGPPTEEFFGDAYRLDDVEVQLGATTVLSWESRLERVLAGENPGQPSTKAVMGVAGTGWKRMTLAFRPSTPKSRGSTRPAARPASLPTRWRP